MTKNIKRTASVHKSDTFTKNQFAWLRQVAADVDLPPTASRVAIALTYYFNRDEDGAAWMSQATLARDLGISERTVRDALASLVDRRHVISKRRGMKETNLYFAVLKDGGDRQSAAGHDRQKVADHDRKKTSDQTGVTGNSAQSDRQIYVRVTGDNLPANPLKEPLKEPNKDIESLSLDLGEEEFGRRRRNHSGEIDAHFEAWWVQYPLKKAKAAGLKTYRGVIAKDLATHDQLMAGVLRYAAERAGQDPRWTKHPATWLNGGCWADEPATSIGSGSPAHSVPGSGNDHIARATAMARQAQARRQANG